ncbi:hypothetical protein C0993_004894, partial [Termitomyces sp. T159_Od127]
MLSSSATVHAHFVLKAADGSVIVSTTAVTSAGHAKADFYLPSGKVDLWYPVGYGKQPLYTIEAKLTNGRGELLDTRVQKIAFRR